MGLKRIRYIDREVAGRYIVLLVVYIRRSVLERGKLHLSLFNFYSLGALW